MKAFRILVILLAFGALTASAQDTGRVVLDGGATLSARASATLHSHCGGVRPSACEASSRSFRIRAATNDGDIRAIDIELSSPGPRPTRARIRTTPPDPHGLQADDPDCAYARLFIETAAGRIAADNGELTLTRWEETRAEGSFSAIFSDGRAPRTVRGTFSVRYRRPPLPPPCGFSGSPPA